MNAQELTKIIFDLQNRVIELEKDSKNHELAMGKLSMRISDLEIDRTQLQFEIERLERKVKNERS